MKQIVYEGDICPECKEGKIVPTSWKPLRLKCDNCGATYNDKGERIPCDNATAGY
jgi:uncharacterized protein (DUF983 family)